MTERGFDRLEAHLSGSWLVRTASRLADAWRAAFGASSIVAAIRDRRDRYRALPDDDRLRAIATFAGTAALVHLLLRGLLPVNLAPALPRVLWMLVVATATVTVVLATRLAAAWPSSTVRRLLPGRGRRSR